VLSTPHAFVRVSLIPSKSYGIEKEVDRSSNDDDDGDSDADDDHILSLSLTQWLTYILS